MFNIRCSSMGVRLADKVTSLPYSALVTRIAERAGVSLTGQRTLEPIGAFISLYLNASKLYLCRDGPGPRVPPTLRAAPGGRAANGAFSSTPASSRVHPGYAQWALAVHRTPYHGDGKIGEGSPGDTRGAGSRSCHDPTDPGPYDGMPTRREGLQHRQPKCQPGEGESECVRHPRSWIGRA